MAVERTADGAVDLSASETDILELLVAQRSQAGDRRCLNAPSMVAVPRVFQRPRYPAEGFTHGALVNTCRAYDGAHDHLVLVGLICRCCDARGKRIGNERVAADQPRFVVAWNQPEVPNDRPNRRIQSPCEPADSTLVLVRPIGARPSTYIRGRLQARCGRQSVRRLSGFGRTTGVIAHAQGAAGSRRSHGPHRGSHSESAGSGGPQGFCGGRAMVPRLAMTCCRSLGEVLMTFRISAVAATRR